MLRVVSENNVLKCRLRTTESEFLLKTSGTKGVTAKYDLKLESFNFSTKRIQTHMDKDFDNVRKICVAFREKHQVIEGIMRKTKFLENSSLIYLLHFLKM